MSLGIADRALGDQFGAAGDNVVGLDDEEDKPLHGKYSHAVDILVAEQGAPGCLHDADALPGLTDGVPEVSAGYPRVRRLVYGFCGRVSVG